MRHFIKYISVVVTVLMLSACGYDVTVENLYVPSPDGTYTIFIENREAGAIGAVHAKVYLDLTQETSHTGKQDTSDTEIMIYKGYSSYKPKVEWVTNSLVLLIVCDTSVKKYVARHNFAKDSMERALSPKKVQIQIITASNFEYNGVNYCPRSYR